MPEPKKPRRTGSCAHCRRPVVLTEKGWRHADGTEYCLDEWGVERVDTKAAPEGGQTRG